MAGKSFVLKITMKHFRPPNWRKILVRDSITLHDLHHIIQALYGFDDEHLHAFNVAGVRFSGPNIWGSEDLEDEDETKITLRKIFGVFCTKIIYTYDFGDDWIFDIVCQKVSDEVPAVGNHSLLKCKGPDAVEDCGGPWGLMELYDIKEHYDEATEEQKEWLGWAFPDEFDAEGNRLDENGNPILTKKKNTKQKK